MKLRIWKGDAATYDAYVTGGGDGGASEAEKNLWTCSNCESQNQISDKQCTDCGQDQPDLNPPEYDDEDDRPHEGANQFDMRSFGPNGVSYHD